LVFAVLFYTAAANACCHLRVDTYMSDKEAFLKFISALITG